MSVRIIPRLDIKGPNLVKGIHLEGLRVLGAPDDFARAYYEAGADEILYMDIVASLYQRNSLHEIVERTSRDIFVPITVGGGLRTLEDIRTVLRAGADKVALNTMALRSPDLIREASRRFGASTIVVSIEAKSRPDGTYEAYTDNGRERTGKEVVAWAEEAVGLGAGEIMITSIDREGTGRGYDQDLTRAVATRVRVPVIACGGAGAADHVVDVVKEGAADAVGLASVLHYERLAQQAKENAGTQRHSFSRVQPTSLRALKRRLLDAGIDVRPPPAGGAPTTSGVSAA